VPAAIQGSKASILSAGQAQSRGIVSALSRVRMGVADPPPRLNGKVERSHRIDDEEFYWLLDGVVLDDAQVFNQKLQEWEDFYNFNRPHGGLDGQTPYDRLRQRATKALA
jgi:transposase InsO family protein